MKYRETRKMAHMGIKKENHDKALIDPGTKRDSAFLYQTPQVVKRFDPSLLQSACQMPIAASATTEAIQ